MFQKNNRQELEFIHGKNATELAARTAYSCDFFQMDDEDEMVSEIVQSCYNCRYRRWTPTTFVCTKRTL